MANDEHLDMLRRGVEAWNAWRIAFPETSPDLSEATLLMKELKLVNFDRANLRSADFWKSNLSGAKLRGADLMRASIKESNLAGIDLSGANLSVADLAEVDLNDADLSATNLYRARLTDVNLSGASCRGAVFGDAQIDRTILINADLTGADFIGTQLLSADLRGVKINHARFGGTILANIDLRSLQGLESVQHIGPSELSVSTMQASGGHIPEVFLRGCGVPDNFITYLPSLTANSIEFYSCFISYSHADKSFARRLYDALQGRGIRCWLDEHQVLPGDDIFEQVDRGIRLWDKVLLCCSKDSLRSWWVDDEITKTYEKEQMLMRQRGEKVLALIPLTLDDYLLSGKWKSGKASQVKVRLAADFIGWKRSNRKFDEQFERLVKALRSDAGGREAPPMPKL